MSSGPSVLLNGKQINIVVLNQPHFSDLSCISSMMRNHLPSFQDKVMKVCTHGMVNSYETELVPASCNNGTIQAPVESAQVFPIETSRELDIQSDYQYLLCNFPFHHHNLVPGSNSIHADDIILNANSKKQSCGSVALPCKQGSASICPLKEFIMINSETKTATCMPRALKSARELSITYNNVSASHDDDAMVPNCDVMMMAGNCKHDVIEKDYPTELCNCEEIPIVPESPSRCKSGLSCVTCKGTCYQDSTVADVIPSNSPVNESYCLTQCCFAAEKDSLVDEDSDYELNLSPTYPHHQQDISTIGSGQGSCDSTSHHDLITSPAESINRIDVINTSPDAGELADDGGATLLQNLPLEMAKQTDTEIIQVCSKESDSIDNTDDDFNGNVGKTQGIACSELPNQKIINITDDLCSNSPTTESGKCFPTKQDGHNHVHNHVCNNNNNDINLQVVPSYDQSLDYDGPSKLLMAMELIERKDHHVPYSLNRWERIFTGSYYGKPNIYTMHCNWVTHSPYDLYSFDLLCVVIKYHS